MSARDAESGSSTYKGGGGRAGGLGNGGIGGGMGGGGNHGGGMGGGAGRNGGIGNRTGLTTGNRMYGGIAVGRPGGMAQNPGAWGVRPSPPVTSAPLNRPAVPGLLGPTPAAMPGVAPVPEYVPNVFNQDYLQSLVDFRNYINKNYTPAPPQAPSGPWPGQGVNPLAQDPMELSNKNWSGNSAIIGGVAGGQGIQSWDSQAGSPPSSRGWGGWNSLGFN